MRTTIANGIAPANAAATVDAKGGDVPLIDTGELVEAISFEITTKPGPGLDDHESYDLHDVVATEAE
jgi:hypothetical protein